MAISLGQFIDNLTRSGLVSADEISAFQESLPPEKRPSDSQGLARELIQAGMLTRYQAAAVYHGKIKGLVLGDYTVLDQIGAGGMGQVLKARHRRMNRVVALKILPARAMKSRPSWSGGSIARSRRQPGCCTRTSSRPSTPGSTTASTSS